MCTGDVTTPGGHYNVTFGELYAAYHASKGELPAYELHQSTALPAVTLEAQFELSLLYYKSVQEYSCEAWTKALDGICNLMFSRQQEFSSGKGAVQGCTLLLLQP